MVSGMTRRIKPSTERFQGTLRGPAFVCGIGLHSGCPVQATLSPAPLGQGIAFVRADLPGRPLVRARTENALEATNQTVLVEDGKRIETPEHLLAALFSLGISDARVTLDAAEVPILDGSARPWIEAIESVGVEVSSSRLRRLCWARPIRLEAEGGSLSLAPASGFSIECAIEQAHPLIGRQRRTYRHDPACFVSEIAPARTFGLLSDVEALKKRGLIRGGSLDNAIVLDQDRVLNLGGLRFPDEFVRHKILDLLGDLALLGGVVEGRISAVNSSHRLHRRFLNLLMEECALGD